MAAIQPKNTTDIKVDNIDEKTAAAGVDLNGIIRFTTSIFKPLAATVELGTTTAAENILIAYIKSVLATADMVLGTTSSNSLTVKTNNVARLVLKSTGSYTKRLGHTGFTSGGEIEELTAALNTVDTSPVTFYTYPIAADDTQVLIRVNTLSRDNTTGAQSYLDATISGSRAGGAASAGSVTVQHTVGAALITLTVTASGTSLLCKAQNASGTNTTSTAMDIRVIPVSTST